MPRPPIQRATFEKPFRRPCLLIVTDFKPFARGASDVSDWGKNLGTHGAPQGAPMEPPWSPQGAPPGGYLWQSVPAPLLTYDLGYLMTYYQYYYQILSDVGYLRIYLWGATYGGLPMRATYGGYFWGQSLGATNGGYLWELPVGQSDLKTYLILTINNLVKWDLYYSKL